MRRLIKKIAVVLLSLMLIVPSISVNVVQAADRWPTQRNNSQFIGISLRAGVPIEWTGMDAWWPNSNGYVVRDSNWSCKIASSISELKAGDVILWYDDYSDQWVNHIGIVVEVAKDNSCFRTAEGNVSSNVVPNVGVAFKTYSGLTRRGSTYGKVVIWRHATKGDIIAKHATRFTQNIIDKKDTSIIDQYDYIDWCFCYVTTVLLEPPSYGQITLDVESATAGSSLNDLLGNVYCIYSDSSSRENSYMASFVTTEDGTAYKVDSLTRGDTRPEELQGKNGWVTAPDGSRKLYVYGESEGKGYTFISSCKTREISLYCGTYYLRGFITGEPYSQYYVLDNQPKAIEVPYDEVNNLTVYAETDEDSVMVEYILDSDLDKYMKDDSEEEAEPDEQEEIEEIQGTKEELEIAEIEPETDSEQITEDAGQILIEEALAEEAAEDELTEVTEQAEEYTTEDYSEVVIQGENPQEEITDIEILPEEEDILEETAAWEAGNEEAPSQPADEITEEHGDYYVTREGKLTSYTGLVYSRSEDYQDQEKALEGWYYAENGKIVSDYTGAVPKGGEIYYCTNGQLDTSLNDWIYCEEGGVNGWRLFEDGKENLSYKGFVCLDNTWMYVENSRLSADTTDIMYGYANGESAWWNVKNGYISFEESVEKNSNGWWYVNNGKVDFSYTGIAKNSNGYWYLENGRVTFKKNDIVYSSVDGDQGWWLIKNSKVAFETTVEHNANGWWYCNNGKVDFEYNGFAKNSNGWWYLEEGRVSFNVNDIILGTVNGKDGWWLIKGSKVSFETTVEHNKYGWWYVRNGVVDFSANTVAHNSNGWWKITNGQVDFSFTGLASNENGTWYLNNGKVDFGYNGTYNGRQIVGGKVY